MRDTHHSSDDGAFAAQNGSVLHAMDVEGSAGASSHAAYPDPAHANGHFVVDDAHLLFSGHFSKSGNDLVVSGDGRAVTVHDYFRGETRAALYAPDGSSLSGEVVTALAGHTSYAQAGDPAAAAGTPIGQVAKLTGSASAIRNGVAVELHIGDKVYKGDVIEAGADSALGISFIDGTAFSLGSHARMVLNEMVYDPNGSSNSSLLSLVQGSITFVAGQTAKNGSMKIDTPVATMGIRGTAVFVDISANDGPTKFSVLVEPGNHVGSYDLYNKVTGDKIGEVSTAGINILISYNSFKELSIAQEAKTLADLQAEQALIQQLFSFAFQKVNDANPKFNFGTIGSGVSPFGGEFFYPFNPQSPPTIKLTNLSGPTDTSNSLSLIVSLPQNPPPIVKVTNVSTVQAGGVANVTVTQSSTPGLKNFLIGNQVQVIDPAVGVAPFYDIAVNYVKGTAVLLGAVGPATLSSPSATAVPANFLTGLISIDTTTGAVSFDPSKFQFLGQGESAVYTIQFDSYGGPSGFDEAHNPPYTVVETLTLTVLGLNDPPVFSGAGTYQYSSGYATALGASSGAQVLGTNTAGTTPVVTAALTERPGVSGASASDAVTIQLPFTDQDFSDVAKNYGVKVLQVSATGVTTGLLPNDNPAQLAAALKSFLSNDGLTKALNSINGNVTEVFSAPDSTFDYLAKGEQLTISYTIQVTDPHGAASNEILNIVVTGTNDAPVIQSSQVKDPGPLQAPVQNGGNWVVASNVYAFTDPDWSDTHTTTAAFDAADSNLHGLSAPIGTISTALIKDSVDGTTGQFSWSLALSAADLAEIYNPKLVAPNTTIVESFDVSVSDPNGGTATKVVTIDIPTVDAWTGAGHDGLWSDQSNWTAGAPGPISNVEIAPTSATTVTISSDDTVYGLNTNASTTLDITAGTLTIAGPISNSIAGPVTNSGIIAVQSDLTIEGAAVTDTGSAAGFSVGTGAALTLQDGAVVSGGTLTNAGTVYVEKSAGATLDGVQVTNTGGTIQVDVLKPASAVPLLLDDGTIVTNGTLSVGGVGVVDVENGAIGPGATLDGVTVNGTAPGTGTPGSLIEVGLTSAATLVLDDGTKVSDGAMKVGGNGVLAIENGGAGITGADATLDDVAVTNNGTIQVGTTTTSEDPTLLLEGGAAVTGGKLVVGNTDAVEIGAGGASLTNVTVQNGAGGAAGGVIQVDGGETLTLSGTTIEGGTINDYTIVSGSIIAGDIDVVGSSTINGNATLNQGGVTVESSQELTLDNVTVNGTALTVTASGATLNVDGGDQLTLDNGVGITGPGGTTANVSNAGTIEVAGATTLTGDVVGNTGTMNVDGGQTLTLSGSTLTGGTINDYTTVSGSIIAGDIDVVGSSTIDGGATLNHGGVTVEAGQQLTLDNVTVDGTAFTVTATGATLNVDGGDQLTLEGGAGITGPGGTIANVTNAGTIEVAGATTLTDDVVGNTGTITVDGGETLTLSGTTLTGGTINDDTIVSGSIIAGDIDIVGSSTINGGAKLNHGAVTIEAGQQLTLDNVTVNGTTFTDTATGATLAVDAGDLLTLNGATIAGGIINDGTGTTLATAGTIKIATSSTIDGGAVLNNGGVTVEASQQLTLDDVTVNGTTIDLTASGATLAVDSGDTLTLQNGAAVTGGTLINTGTLDFESSSGATLNGVDVTNKGAHLKVDTILPDPTPLPATPLVLEGGTTVTGGELDIGSTSGELQVKSAAGASLVGVTVVNAGPYGIEIDAGSTLKLDGGSVTGGTIDDGTALKAGTIEIVHSATITSAALNNGNVNIDANQTLTLDNDTVAGTTFSDTASGATLAVGEGDTLILQAGASVSGGSLTNAGTLDIESWEGAALTGVAVANTGGTIQVGPDETSVEPLLLAGGTTITGGQLDIDSASGEVLVVTTAGASLIDVAVTNGGPYGIQIGKNSTLTVDDSSVTGGTVNDKGTLSVDGGKTLTLSGVTITGGTINDGTGASAGKIEITGSSSISNATLNHGGVTVDAKQTLTLNNVTDASTAITNNGTIDVHTGNVKLGAAVSGTGTIDVDVGTKLEFGSSVSVGQTIDFTGTKGTTAEIVLDQAQNFHATVSGFTGIAQTTSDLIDLQNINYNSTHFTENYNSTTELLTVSDGSQSAQIQFAGFNGSLHFTTDGHNGTLIYDPPAASAPGGQGSAPIVVASNDVFMFGAGHDSKSGTETVQLPGKNWHDYFNPPADGGVGAGDHWAVSADPLHLGTGVLAAADAAYIDALLQKHGGHLAANDFILHPGAHA